MFFWCDDDHFRTTFDCQWARAATKITKFIYLLLFMKRKLILSHIILKITNEKSNKVDAISLLFFISFFLILSEKNNFYPSTKSILISNICIW